MLTRPTGVVPGEAPARFVIHPQAQKRDPVMKSWKKW